MTTMNISNPFLERLSNCVIFNLTALTNINNTCLLCYIESTSHLIFWWGGLNKHECTDWTTIIHVVCISIEHVNCIHAVIFFSSTQTVYEGCNFILGKLLCDSYQYCILVYNIVMHVECVLNLSSPLSWTKLQWVNRFNYSSYFLFN